MTGKKKTMDGGLFGISNPITNNKARNTSDADFNKLYQQLTRVDQGLFSRMGNEVKVGDRILDFLKIFNYRLSKIMSLHNKSNLDEFYKLYTYFQAVKNRHPNHINDIIRNEGSSINELYMIINNKINEYIASIMSDTDFNKLYQQLVSIDPRLFKGNTNKNKFSHLFLDFLIIFDYRLQEIIIPRDSTKFLILYNYLKELKKKYQNHIIDIMKNKDSQINELFLRIMRSLNNKTNQYIFHQKQLQSQRQPNNIQQQLPQSQYNNTQKPQRRSNNTQPLLQQSQYNNTQKPQRQPNNTQPLLKQSQYYNTRQF